MLQKALGEARVRSRIRSAKVDVDAGGEQFLSALFQIGEVVDLFVKPAGDVTQDFLEVKRIDQVVVAPGSTQLTGDSTH